MTEAEWLACDDPTPMLEFLRGKASDRKLRLFACACCRRTWLRWGETSAPNAIELSERFADGRATRSEMRMVLSQLGARGGFSAAWAANCAEFAVLEEAGENAATQAVRSALHFAYHLIYEQTFSRSTYTGDEMQATEAKERERKELPAVMREIVGNHFRPAALDPAWLAWNNGTVAKLATATYDARRFADLPILADALEDAGCTDAAILAHCRQPGEHVRGCWVVDLVLGKS